MSKELQAQRAAVSESIEALLYASGRADDRGQVEAMATFEVGATIARAILVAGDTIAAALDRQPAPYIGEP